MFQDHAGLPEPLRDQVDEHMADLEAEVEEEIQWLADEITPRTPLSRDLVLDVLRQRERVLAEADAA